jgi:LPS export ABC transporter protein LptC
MRSAAQRARILRDRLVAAAATLAAVALAYGVFVGGDEEDLDAGPVEDERGYYLKAARLTEMGVDGAPRIVLRAETIEQRLADGSVLLYDLDVDYRTPEAGLWTVTSERGRMPADHHSLLLSGDVTVTGEQARGAAVIRTDNLAYDTDSSVIQTADPVAVQFGAHHLEGRGLRVVLDDGSLRLESNVRGRFNP